MTVPSPRLVTWENGTDLVIEMPLDRTPGAVWEALVDGPRAADWFAPFTVDGDIVTVDLGEPDSGDTALAGRILSCEAGEHVLVEFTGFGVVGIRLLPVDIVPDLPVEAGPEAAALAASALTPEGTVLVLTQSSADEEGARDRAADDGPMWDTHLRLFARSLGVATPEVSDDELTRVYADLALETDDDTIGGLGQGGR